MTAWTAGMRRKDTFSPERQMAAFRHARTGSNIRVGEGFGMPLGVAKPPMQEPAVRTLCAMGFAVLVRSGGCQELRHQAFQVRPAACAQACWRCG